MLCEEEHRVYNWIDFANLTGVSFNRPVDNSSPLWQIPKSPLEKAEETEIYLSHFTVLLDGGNESRQSDQLLLLSKKKKRITFNGTVKPTFENCNEL